MHNAIQLELVVMYTSQPEIQVLSLQTVVGMFAAALESVAAAVQQPDKKSHTPYALSTGVYSYTYVVGGYEFVGY